MNILEMPNIYRFTNPCCSGRKVSVFTLGVPKEFLSSYLLIFALGACDAGTEQKVFM